MFARIRSQITLWRVIVAVIFATGLYATYVRFFEGFRASTNLSDQMPWGLWVGLGTLCGVGLSAAGFGIVRPFTFLVWSVIAPSFAPEPSSRFSNFALLWWVISTRLASHGGSGIPS